MVFRMFLAFLIFDPNWPFCKGYSLSNMADFQTCLISRLFGVFSSGFLHRTILVFLKNGFSHNFEIFSFLPKLTILKRLYSLCKMADFQTCLISRIFGVFSSGFLHRKALIFLQNCFSHVFGFFNFSPKLTILQRL